MLDLDGRFTREDVLDFDVEFLDDLFDAWEECPPVRRLVAAAVGYKPKPKPSTNYEQLLAMFPGGVIKG